jgi:hypothetical protein
MTQQSLNLARVKSTIAPLIVQFCRSRIQSRFTMAELVAFVAERVTGAPDSPSRILRCLRAEGALDYVVLSRKSSTYFVASVASDL